MRTWIEILFENAQLQQLYINFPKYNFQDLPMSVFDRMSATEAEIYIQTKFVTSLASYYEDECSFLQSLVDCLRRTAMRESLSDNQKYLVSLDKPFNSNVSDHNIS